MMMENVLVNFEDTGYSFYFISSCHELRSFEGDPGYSSWGSPIRTQLQLAFSVQETHWKSLTAGQSLLSRWGTSATEVLSRLDRPSWSKNC